MGQSERAGYYQALKKAGVQFDKHYRDYSTEELKAAFDKLQAGQPSPPPPPEPSPPPVPNADDQRWGGPVEPELPPQPTAPLAERDPNEFAGARLNTQLPDEPIRVDEEGRIWYQEEVLKKGYAAPRGRRVLRTNDAATRKETVQAGQFTETFEVAGEGPLQATEIKITLPSYQEGIYKDPRYPFKIHTYNGVQGFDFEEVARYYGGVDLVPEEIRRVYVENVLCYDMRTTIRTIQQEFRQQQLAGMHGPTTIQQGARA
jgi:hypothetical protein